MNHRHLQLFLHLAKTLSFARTSAACHVTPSSLSRVIQRLEAEVGEKLFERDSRRVVLTKTGHAFRPYAEQVSEGWMVFRQTLRQGADQLQGELSLFCSVTASYSFLDEILGELRDKHPGIELKLHTGDSAEALERISTEREDVGIAALPDKIPPRFEVQVLTHTPIVFIAPQNNRVTVPDELEAGSKEWEQVPLILSEAGLVRDRADQWFRSQHISPYVYSQVAGHEAIVSMVGLGMGVGLVPKIVLENSPLASRVRQLPISHSMPPFAIGLCVLKRKLGNPLIAAFWNLVSQSIVRNIQL